MISWIFCALYTYVNITLTKRTSRPSLRSLEENNVLSDIGKLGIVQHFHIVFRLLRVNPYLLNCSLLTNKLCTVPVLRLCTALAVRRQYPLQFQAIFCVVSCSPAGQQYTENRNFNLRKLNLAHLAVPSITFETGLFVPQPDSELCDKLCNKFSELKQTSKYEWDIVYQLQDSIFVCQEGRRHYNFGKCLFNDAVQSAEIT
jgi:hypothetical protein